MCWIPHVSYVMTAVAFMLGSYLEFHLKSHCFPRLTRTGDTDGWFVDRRDEKTKRSIQKTLATQYVVECQLFTLVIAWLGAEAHSPRPASLESVVLHIVSLGNDQNSKFEVPFLMNVYAFYHCEVENSNHKLGTICTGHPHLWFLYFVNSPTHCIYS